MTKRDTSNTNRLWVAVIIAMGLGPLAAFTFGQRYAGEETMARAEAGERNYEPPDRFPDNAYGVPKLTGAAAETTVRDVTADTPLFDDFRRAVQDTGFGQVLEGPGPLTVFVPTNKAFEQLGKTQRQDLFGNKDKLRQMLSDHIVRGELTATDLIQRNQVKTLGGTTVPINHGGKSMSFGSADIVKTNLAAGNGVVHIVDGLNL